MLSSVCLNSPGPLGASVRSWQFSKDGRRVTNMKIGRLMVVWAGTVTKCSHSIIFYTDLKALVLLFWSILSILLPPFFFLFLFFLVLQSGILGFVKHLWKLVFLLRTSTQPKCLAHFTYFACLSNCWVAFPFLASWCPLCWCNITRFVSCNNEMRSKAF